MLVDSGPLSRRDEDYFKTEITINSKICKKKFSDDLIRQLSKNTQQAV